MVAIIFGTGSIILITERTYKKSGDRVFIAGPFSSARKRNGLVHDASLTCETNSGDWYIFRYNYKMQASVKAAKIPWDGSAANLNRDSLTLINPRFFTDQISDALHVLRSCYFDRRTDFDILKPADDILHKYLFWQNSSPS